jgi:hypothetical protein
MERELEGPFDRAIHDQEYVVIHEYWLFDLGGRPGAGASWPWLMSLGMIGSAQSGDGSRTLNSSFQRRLSRVL